MRIAAYVLALVVSIGAALAQPAAAIETTEFGIEPVDAVTDAGGIPRLVVEIRPGTSTSTVVRVWNRAEQALTLAMTAVPAEVDERGTASLSGDDEVARWASFEPAVVPLAAGESRTINVTIAVPRGLTPEPRTMAVLVQPTPAPGSPTPAVLQRLALVAYLQPVTAANASGGAGFFPWAAAALAVATVTIGSIVVVRHRRDSASETVTTARHRTEPANVINRPTTATEDHPRAAAQATPRRERPLTARAPGPRPRAGAAERR